jgi:hypothetical protein
LRQAIKWNELPGQIKKFLEQGSLTEGHLREITRNCNVPSFFHPWLSTESAQLELTTKASGNGKKKDALSVRDTSAIGCNSTNGCHPLKVE